jgi:hypothetical protein
MKLNGLAQGLLDLKKKFNKQSLKIDPGTQKTLYVKCNKTIIALRPWSILLFSAP